MEKLPKAGSKMETRYGLRVTILGYVGVRGETWCRVRFDNGDRMLVHPTGLLPCAS